MEEDVVVAKHDRPDEEPADVLVLPRQEKTVRQPLVENSSPRPIADEQLSFMRGQRELAREPLTPDAGRHDASAPARRLHELRCQLDWRASRSRSPWRSR